MKKITIGARGSLLSQTYVEKVKNLIIETSDNINGINISKKIIKTTGDIQNNIKLSEIGGKNYFAKKSKKNYLQIILTARFTL